MALRLADRGCRCGSGPRAHLGARLCAGAASGLLALLLAALPGATLAAPPAADCSCTTSACRKCAHPHGRGSPSPSLAPLPCHGSATPGAASEARHAEPGATSEPGLVASCNDAHGGADAHVAVRIVLSEPPLLRQPDRSGLAVPLTPPAPSAPAAPPEPPPPRA
jgi:hypothetical protein